MDLDSARDVLKPLRDTARPAGLCPVTEAALRARMNPFTIWKLIRQGRLRAWGSRGRLRVSMDDLLEEYRPNGGQGR